MKAYTLENYKLIKKQNFDLRKFNIIIGENSSGKSSLLRSLQLLKQSSYFSFQNLNSNFKNGVDFGEYRNLLNDEKSGDEKIFFEIKFENKVETYIELEIFNVKWGFLKNNLSEIEIELNDFTLFIELNQKTIKKVTVDGNEIEFLRRKKIVFKKLQAFPCINKQFEGEQSIIIRFLDSMEGLFKYNYDNMNNVKIDKTLNFIKKKNSYLTDSPTELSAFLEIINNVTKVKEKEILYMVNNILHSTSVELKKIFYNTIYTGPIRSLGERYYRIGSDYPFDYDLNNDVNSKLYALSLSKNKKNLSSFNQWIKKYFDFEVSIEVLKSPENETIFYSIEIQENGIKKNIIDIGAGYSQMLPILYACFEKSNQEKQLLIIEQPELHLHPKMQSNLIDAMLKLSKENPQLKFIIETHSSLIIDRIGKHIYLKNYSEQDLNVYLFEKKDKDLIIDKTIYKKNGILDRWPIGFFSAKEIEKW